MMKRKIYNKIWAVPVCVALIALSCDRKKDSPGYIFYPDMAYSQAYETYAPNPVFEDGSSMRTPVKGTIPRDMVPYHYDKEERELAGKELVNPLQYDDKLADRGKKQYEIFCMVCHGEKGDGMGFLFTSGKYPFPVRSLLTPTVQQVPEGEIYHVITMGYGVMGAHGPMITPEDRWRIVNYIKDELGKNR